LKGGTNLAKGRVDGRGVAGEVGGDAIHIADVIRRPRRGAVLASLAPVVLQRGEAECRIAAALREGVQAGSEGEAQGAPEIRAACANFRSIAWMCSKYASPSVSVTDACSIQSR
jgi:hypothetical protein